MMCPQGNCAVVYNSLPLLEMLSKDARRVADSIDLLNADVLAVYPARLTPGKRFEKVAALAGSIQRKTEQRTKVIFCDFHQPPSPGEYVWAHQRRGGREGRGKGDLVFSSALAYEQGLPRQGVFELFGLSNLFLCPSYSNPSA